MSDAPSTFSADDVELARKRFGAGSNVASTSLVLAGVALNMFHDHGHAFLGLLGSLVMIAGTALGLAWQFWKRRDRGRLDLTASTLFFAGRPLMARAAIKQAYGFERGGAAATASSGKRSVRIGGAAGCDLTFAGVDEADAFLAAVAQSVSDTTATFHAFAGGRRTRVVVTVAALALMFGVIGVWTSLMISGALGRTSVVAPFLMVLPAIVPLFFMRAVAIRQLIVGTDGVLLKGPFGRSEFLPLARVKGAAVDRTDVHLSIEGEPKPRKFALGGLRRMQGADVDVPARALVQRIEEVRARSGDRPAGAATAALLSRNRRSIADWIREVSLVTDSAATFRSAAIPRDQLWRVIDDATAETELRVGAAIALRRELGDEERTRFRVASNVSAEPALRKVFLAVTEDDEAHLEAAVAELKPRSTAS